MPSFKYVIELSDQDKAKLMGIVKKGNSPARTILRANILLASDKQNDKYMTVSEIADACHTTPTTVQTVRTSYCEKGLEATINRKKRETPLIPAIRCRTNQSLSIPEQAQLQSIQSTDQAQRAREIFRPSQSGACLCGCEAAAGLPENTIPGSAKTDRKIEHVIRTCESDFG